MANNIYTIIAESIAVKQQILNDEALQNTVQQITDAVVAAFEAGHKVMFCGNGGSAADAQHCAAEFVGRFKIPNRRGLPAIALSADSALLTAWSNDVGYDYVFSRQIEAFAQPNDLVIGISTSGRSKNILEAFEMAQSLGIPSIGILGGDGGHARSLCDLSIVVPATDPQHIQEVQIIVIHLLCELVEAWVMNHEQKPKRQRLRLQNRNHSGMAIEATSIQTKPAFAG